MRLRNLIPCSTKLTIKSSILPYLTYCQLSWYGTSVRPPTAGK